MRIFTTKIRLDKTPLVLQGIDGFLGKVVKITISEVKPLKKRKWRMFGTAHTGKTMKNINLRDFAYE